MAIFPGHSVYSENGEIILLKFIETLRVRETPDAVIDRLKGDVTLVARSISGKEYIISMNVQKTGCTSVGKELADAIVDKWLWINKP